jgi:GMP synthase-like glutamine amidotransferase
MRVRRQSTGTCQAGCAIIAHRSCMAKSLRVVLLQTDSVLEQFQPEFGDYPAMFENLLEHPDIELSAHDVRFNLPAAGAGDGYVITGSRHSVYDDLPWIRQLAAFLDGEIKAGKKVVGICFGHQLLAHFFGGEVRPAVTGWEVGVKETDIRERLDWMQPPTDQVNLLSSHKDQVAVLPAGARLSAQSGSCPIAGFTMGNNVITFQGHPEFRKAYSRSLIGYRREILGEQVYNAGLDSLKKSTDESLVGHWIQRFLLGKAAESDADRKTRR